MRSHRTELTMPTCAQSCSAPFKRWQPPCLAGYRSLCLRTACRWTTSITTRILSGGIRAQRHPGRRRILRGSTRIARPPPRSAQMLQSNDTSSLLERQNTVTRSGSRRQETESETRPWRHSCTRHGRREITGRKHQPCRAAGGTAQELTKLSGHRYRRRYRSLAFAQNQIERYRVVATHQACPHPHVRPQCSILRSLLSAPLRVCALGPLRSVSA
jgi:hypothetical protein